MNTPNLLSLFRILFTFFFILAVYHDRFDYALYLFVLQGLTDMLDGFLARVMKEKTELGAYLDPIADKTMILAAFIMLSIKQIVPLWLPATVILKDVAVAIGFLILYKLVGHIKPVPSIFGKLSTTFQIAAVLFVLVIEMFSLSKMYPYSEALIVATAFITIIAGLHYILYGIKTLRAFRAGRLNS